MKIVAIGGREHERVEIAIHGYERQMTGEWHDDNWISVKVTIRAGAFCGAFVASFITDELRVFREQLMCLYTSCVGQAVFDTLEGQLHLKLEGEPLGRVRLEGRASDQPGSGNKLNFVIDVDQSHLKSAIGDIDEALEMYPVRA